MMDLEPCPFCGGEAELREMAPYPNQAPDRWWAMCAVCDVAPNEAWDKPREEAIAAWNTRTASHGEASEVERLRQVLEQTQLLVARAAVSGFVDEDAVTELYENNGAIAAALSDRSKQEE